jgi:peptidoglycan hydrolase-like protein with peptidoglycan-binding domain
MERRTEQAKASAESAISEKQASKSNTNDIAVIYEKSNPSNLKMVTYAKPSTVKAMALSKSSIKDVQTKLNAIGYSCGTPDGIAGKNTKAAVTSFQKLCGLKNQSGDITSETITKLNSVYNRSQKGVLSRGLRNNASVKKLQENLNKLNFNCGTPDGTFGAGTETALKNFQKANKLTVDGLAGSATLNAIQKAVNNLKQPVTPSKGLSENGFKLLASYEATSAVKDKKGNVVSIPILDVGDGMYTIGIGNTVKKTDTKTIQEYKEKYGVDVTKVGAQVDIKTCMKIYNDHVNTYTSTVDNLLKRHNYTASQNEYDALVIAVYNRPALAKEGHALDTLIKNNNRNKDDWRTTLINEYKGLKNWNTYGKGWSNRIEDELELYFDNDYVRNH